MRRGKIEPGREAGEARAIRLHLGDRLRGDELGPLAAEEIGVGDHEILDAALGGEGSEVIRHGYSLSAGSCE